MKQDLPAWLHKIHHGMRIAVSTAQQYGPACGRVGAYLLALTFKKTKPVLMLALIGGIACAIWRQPPLASVGPGQIVLRINHLSGEVDYFQDGSFLQLPGIHALRLYPARDQIYRPLQSASVDGEAPFQSRDGRWLGVDLLIRYKLEPAKLNALSPQNIGQQVVEPAVQSIIYKTMARYTVQEIFSSKRAEITDSIAQELRPALAQRGVLLRSVAMGKVDLPPDCMCGAENLLAEQSTSEKKVLDAGIKRAASPASRAGMSGAKNQT